MAMERIKDCVSTRYALPILTGGHGNDPALTMR